MKILIFTQILPLHHITIKLKEKLSNPRPTKLNHYPLCRGKNTYDHQNFPMPTEIIAHADVVQLA